jgi:hypothetical protein
MTANAVHLTQLSRAGTRLCHKSRPSAVNPWNIVDLQAS